VATGDGGRRRERGTLPANADLREAVLDATARLLDARPYSDLSVADVLAEAGISRGSFYFYFAGKGDVLAELVRRAVRGGHEAAEPWLSDPADAVAALRSGISAGADLWRRNAGVLRAVVENWRGDPALTALWQEQMASFTAATVTQLRSHPDVVAHLGPDLEAVAASLTWLGERLYYLAAIGQPPFDDPEVLVRTLLRIWTSTLYPAVPPDPAESPSPGDTGG
jgi:TetR/AcrR family transcriptional regulator, ethionamide resistance regulator